MDAKSAEGLGALRQKPTGVPSRTLQGLGFPITRGGLPQKSIKKLGTYLACSRVWTCQTLGECFTGEMPVVHMPAPELVGSRY
jgi:hypothetical protein